MSTLMRNVFKSYVMENNTREIIKRNFGTSYSNDGVNLIRELLSQLPR